MKFLQKISNSKSLTFTCLLVCFILGVTAASLINLKRPLLFWLYCGLMAETAFLILFWFKKEFRLLILGGIFLFLGLSRFALSEPPADAHHLRFYNGRLVEIAGVVAEDPKENNEKQTVVVEGKQLEIVNLLTPLRTPDEIGDEAISNNNEIAADRFSIGPRHDIPVKGRAIFYLPAYPKYQYGDRLKIVCELTEPQKSEGFDYPSYLARQGIWSVGQPWQIEKIGQAGGSWLMTKIRQIKSALTGRVNKILPEPQASFLNGLLYGARSAIPSDLQTAFNRTGTTHIIAISGYNITIIAVALLAILKGLRVPRQKAFWLAVAGIVFFVFLTGASASVARAGLMGILVLLARQIGRLSQVGRVLILTAFAMILLNPRLLFFDAGFQLSFASTLGLIYLAPILERPFNKSRTIFGLKESLLTTFSAIIATLPLILYQFGRFSLVAPLTNLLILFAIPLTMALGFGAVVLSFIFLPLGQVAGWLVWLPLTYIIKIVEFFSNLEWSSLMTPKMPWWGMMIIYLGMIMIIFHLKSQYQNSKS